MTLTVLFDLDDTLLANNMDDFLPAYLGALSMHMQAVADPKACVQQVLTATELMVRKTTPERTLEQVFDASFYSALGLTRRQVQREIDQFYDDIFPTLQRVTKPQPYAVETVQYAFKRGHTVAIATNPLFPRAATRQRLEWAGLSMRDYPYGLVSTYEDFHFSKPHPAYIAEILGQLGFPQQPAVFIGNDLKEDLIPAAALGLPCYWLNGSSADMAPGRFHPLSAAGRMEDIAAWLDRVDEAQPEIHFEHPAAILAILKATPAALETMTRSLSLKQWTTRVAEDEWALNEIVCHLRDVDREVHMPRFQKMCDEENPFLPGVDSDAWIQERNYREQDGRAALNDLMTARTGLILLLESLSSQGWQRSARHAIFGPTTLRELADFVSTHDRSHLNQIKTSIQSLKDRG